MVEVVLLHEHYVLRAMLAHAALALWKRGTRKRGRERFYEAVRTAKCGSPVRHADARGPDTVDERHTQTARGVGSGAISIIGVWFISVSHADARGPGHVGGTITSRSRVCVSCIN